MRFYFTVIIFLSLSFICLSQAGSPASPYYTGFNWTMTGMELRDSLSSHITNTHTRLLTYGETENAIKVVDRDPSDGINVFLIYGFTNDICDYVDETNYGTFTNWTLHRKRHHEADQPSSLIECVWNREHVFAKNSGTPALEDNFPSSGTDAHNIRTCDVNRNTLRGNRLFASGSGNSGTIGLHWYPGDEWKGDVARMIMYMYLRYPTQCKPAKIGTGPVVTSDPEMVQLFLQWNAEDPVSPYEDIRNTYLGNLNNDFSQGNRNPFIDNPFLATRIWGGPPAQNRWPIVLNTETILDIENSISIYPNPVSNNTINIMSAFEWDEIVFSNINGQETYRIHNLDSSNNQFDLPNFQKGFYFVTFQNEELKFTKKLVVQ
jgi:endonuclease I